MPLPTRVAALAMLALLLTALGGCTLQPPSRSSAHPDARNSGPFWERNEQRD